MNTINPVRPYVNLKNEPIQPQTVATEPAVSFKGHIGDTLLREAAAKKTVPTVETIFSKIKSTFGVSADKTKDVLESFVGKIKGLTTENAALKEELATTVSSMRQKEQAARAEFADMERNLRNSFSETLESKNSEIATKDAKIAELQKYEGMAKVKSVEELDEILPAQFLDILKEAKESEKKAQDSLLDFVFTGKGQEEFLAQIERSNNILRARKSGIEQMPEMRNAYQESQLHIGYDPVIVSQRMLERALKYSPRGTQISYPPIEKVVTDNFNAITKPMITDGRHYGSLNVVLTDVKKYFSEAEKNHNELLKKGYEFTGRHEFKGVPYNSYVNKSEGTVYDITLDDLSYHNFGYARVTDSNGRVSSVSKFWETIKK